MLLGITGTIGAGKSTAVSYLEKKGFKHISMSGYLIALVTRLGLSPTRVVLRNMANTIRAHSSGIGLIEDALAGVDFVKDDIAVEALHTLPEVEYLKNNGGRIIAVNAKPQLRWERVQARGSIKDAVSYEDFLAEEKRQMRSDDENENNLIAAIYAADFHVENNSSEEELFKALDAILAELHG